MEPTLPAGVDAEVVALSSLTTLRLGGPAGRFLPARTEPELIAAVRDADSRGESLLVLAGGSNVVVSDSGWPGTVLHVLTHGVTERRDGDRVHLEVQAGEPWDPLVERCVESGLAGLECLSGIPGSVGATPIQNVGAYGQEVADAIATVRVLDRDTDQVLELDREECGFAYRSSRFRGSRRWIVLAVTFALEASERSQPIRYTELARHLGVASGETAPLAEVRAAVLALRRGKGMVVDAEDPDSVSAGSFFTNPILDPEAFAVLRDRVAEHLGADQEPPGYPEPDGRVKTSAAWLIERAGFVRGYGSGPAGISVKHTLALVNRGGATTAELLAVAREIADGVQERFGVRLRPEPILIGHAWDEAPG